MKVKARVVITPDKVVVGEKILIFESSGADLLVEIYKKKVGELSQILQDGSFGPPWVHRLRIAVGRGNAEKDGLRGQGGDILQQECVACG